MGFLAFLTCGTCSSRRKRDHESSPDTITIPSMPASHNAAPAQHHPYQIHPDGNQDGSHTDIEGQRNRQSSNPQARMSSGYNRASSGPSRISAGLNRASSGPTRLSNGLNRASSGAPRASQHRALSGASRLRGGQRISFGQSVSSSMQQRPRPHSQQRPARPQQQRHDHPGGRSNNEPVAAPDMAQPKSEGSASSGNDRDLEITEKSRLVANRVLEQFHADPTLGRSRIPYSSLYFTRVLSKGAFGEVWLAQLENRQVAVKRILNEKKNDVKEIECFGAEIKLMASFSHPKIVEFVGVSWSSMQDLCAVTEYMGKGDLHGFLKRRQGQLNWRDHKIFLLEDVADALGYLHGLSPMVIHRDLKSKNILLDDAFRAKLSDFGISRERAVEDTMTAGVGTIYWTAPEVLMGKKYTEKADIYSFGIVMSELDTHAVPYSDKRDSSGKKLQSMKIVQMVIRRNVRPTFTPECPPLVKELADRCLDSDPNVRPSATELLQIIQRMQHLL